MGQNTTLDKGLTLRPTAESDFDDVLSLIIECDVDELGHPDYDAPDLRDDWTRAPVLEDVSRVVVSTDGRLAGYAFAYDRLPVRLTGSAYTKPSQRGRGIGTTLTRWLVERAATRLDTAPEAARVIFEIGTNAENAAAMELLANEGFTVHRYMLRMTISLDQPTPGPSWPDGIAVHRFALGKDDRATYEAVEESFSDHWGWAPRAYETWRHTALGSAAFDPSLWLLAKDGDEIAGVALCSDHPETGEGWINTVGVRRPWRRSGVGLALMYEAFNALRSRGRSSASLGVDAQSLTGATRLYEKAGMHVAHRFAMCAKELRAGVETTVQALAD